MRLARIGWPPFYGQRPLARFTKLGYTAPTATIHHSRLTRGSRVYVGDGVHVYGGRDSASCDAVVLGDDVCLYDGVRIQTAKGGSVRIGPGVTIQPDCQVSAHVGDIQFGAHVQVARHCAFYAYNHGFEMGQRIIDQPLTSKGPIVIGDDAWLGYGVIVLDGVSIGEGAVIGAGSVVTRDVPSQTIAVGNPAKVVGTRPHQSQSHD